ncbi:MAG: SDR family NAD(P)-dependent oxidoreductase [Rhodanobacteraceae bacterium]
MTAIVVGASSGVGRALATELARCGWPLLLIASDLRDIEAQAADLHLRFNVATRALALDLAREPDPGARVIASLGALPAPTALLLPVGNSSGGDDFSLDAVAVGKLVAINLHVPLAIVHALLPSLLETHAVIVGFGSVAAARGRSRNVVYAAAKRGLDSLFESLRHRYRPQELRVQFYRLGFVRSNLTFGQELPLPAAEPSAIARTVVRRLRGRSGDWYLPRWWAIVALLVKLLPLRIYRRLKN